MNRQTFINNTLKQASRLLAFVCLSGLTVASPFEIMPGLWQSVTTITRNNAYGQDEVITDHQVLCLDEVQAQSFFPALQELYQNLNQKHILDTKNRCSTQNSNSATQIKQTTSCKVPGEEDYSAFLLVNSFNNQHQYVTNINTIHPDRRRIKIKGELYYLGECVKK